MLARIHLNGYIMFVQGYSCRKENVNFNLEDSTMESKLSQTCKLQPHKFQQVSGATIVFICGSSKLFKLSTID